jgi:hypothetical protein
LKSSHILHLQQQLSQTENAEIGLRLIFNEVYVTAGGELVAESKTHYEFVDGLLSLHVDIAVAEAFPPMSYASIELPLNHKVNDIEWFGCGARGAHIRNSNSQSAIVGLRRMTIAELCEILQMRNERSSTFGNVRWVAVTNKDGVGLRLKAVRPLFEFSIRKDRIVPVNEMANDSNSWQWLLNLKFRPDVPRQETRRICFDLHFEAGVPETMKTETAPEKTQA